MSMEEVDGRHGGCQNKWSGAPATGITPQGKILLLVTRIRAHKGDYSRGGGMNPLQRFDPFPIVPVVSGQVVISPFMRVGSDRGVVECLTRVVTPRL